MTCAHGLATVLALTIAVAQLPAQGIANSNPGVRGNSYPWGFSRWSRPRSFSFSTYYGGPFGFGYGSPFGFSSVTILQPYAPPPTVIIVVPRDSLIRDRDRDREREDRPPEGVIRFRPRHDRDREEQREKEKAREAKPVEPIPPPEPKPELVPPPQPLEPPKPQPNTLPPAPRVEPPKAPLSDSARHLDLGKEAFAAGEYGRAAFRFRKAAEIMPNQAAPYFLLAQALLALGKYRDAVSAIHAGLPLDPTWPATGPRFAALYGPNDRDFALHLQQLGAAVAQHPDDPVLLFLHGVVLWFDDRKDDARPLFEKAAPRVPDRKDIDRFLQNQ